MQSLEITKVIIEFLTVIIWPATVLVILLMFRKEVRVLFNRTKKIELPGDVSLEEVQRFMG
jgi:hypothetical protein